MACVTCYFRNELRESVFDLNAVYAAVVDNFAKKCDMTINHC